MGEKKLLSALNYGVTAFLLTYFVTLSPPVPLEGLQTTKKSTMKTKVKVLTLLAVVATVILSSCGASRKAGCDAYGSAKTEVKSNQFSK